MGYVAAYAAYKYAENAAYGNNAKRTEKCVAGAVENAAENIASEVVRAHDVGCGGGLELGGGVQRSGTVGSPEEAENDKSGHEAAYSAANIEKEVSFFLHFGYLT